MANDLDRERIREAFARLGEHLRAAGRFLEIAVYGGSAIALRFDWRGATEDVDAVVREGFDERDLAGPVAAVAREMDLDADWLNNAVGAFTPLDEDDAWFEVAGDYPSAADPGLRVVTAGPRYLLAMKLAALANPERWGRDLGDAAGLASEVGITKVGELYDLYHAIHAEAPSALVRETFEVVLQRGSADRASNKPAAGVGDGSTDDWDARSGTEANHADDTTRNQRDA